MKHILFFTILSFASFSLCMNQSPPIQRANTWAHKKLNAMSLEEKIGQLFMVATVSDPRFVSPGKSNDTFLKHCPYKTDHSYIKSLIQQHHIGGIIFLGYGNPKTQKMVTKQLQQLSKTPLLVGQDCEWGLSMRLEKTTKFPHNMTLGAIQDNELIYNLGKEIGRQCVLLGIHINFAPVVDINTNPNNPIINDRSFGEDEKKVTTKALAYMRGLQAAGVLACAKHFPGHGDTATDSHTDLPIIDHNKQRLEKIEFHPFKQLIKNGITAIMTAHIAVPALEKKINHPATLSKHIITDVLKKKLAFDGLVITDGLGMSGVTKNFAPGNIELQALLAGNDILLCPLDVPKAVTLIKQAIKNKQITEQEINKHVLKILYAKQWISNQRKKMVPNNAPLLKQLNTMYARALKQGLYKKAITLVRDTHRMIPITTNKQIPLVLVGTQKKTAFAKTLENQTHSNIYYAPKNLSPKDINHLLKSLSFEEQIIIGVHGMNRFAQENYGLTPDIINLINVLCANTQVTLAAFGNPYSLKHFKKASTVICAYEDDKDAQIATAQILLGKAKAEGKLPVTV